MNIRNFLISLAVLIISQLFTKSAAALCLGVSISSVPSVLSFQGSGTGYNVYDTGEYIKTVNFSITGNASILPCNYFVVLSTGGSGNAIQRTMSGSTTLNYNVYVDPNKSNILRDYATATSSTIITGTFPTSLQPQTNNHSFYWTVNKQQVVKAGNYSDNSLIFTVYTGTLGALPAQADTKNISFQAPVESSVDLSLVSSGGSFNIADTSETLTFNPLTTSAQQAFSLIVRSNDGYKITMQSNNNQTLRHSLYPTVSDVIDYSLTFNGGSVNLSSGSAVQVTASSGTVTSAAGTSFPASVTIGSVPTSKTAGTYNDYISVNVSSN